MENFRRCATGVLGMLLTFSGLSTANGQEPAEPTDPEAAALAEDYNAIEGAWQRTVSDSRRGTITITKVETNGVSVVTARDAGGKILHRHRSDYRLRRTGKVRIFEYSNRSVTEGKDAGTIQAGPFEYIYRIEGNRFIEIHGMLIGEERSPSLHVWDRVPQEPGDREA